MSTNTRENPRLINAMRVLAWSAAAIILLLPAVAMQFTDEVDWTAGDFIVMGVMLLLACGSFELATRVTRSLAYVVASAIAVGAAFLMTWVNLAVGIIGSEDNPANLMFAGVLLVGFTGALLALFEPRGMARAMLAAALAQALVAVVAVVIYKAYTLVISAFFIVLWLTAAALYRRAAVETQTRTPESE